MLLKGVNSELSFFNYPSYAGALSTRVFGQNLKVLAKVDSTQDAVMRMGSLPAEGYTCVADIQTSGKGRGGNQWESPLGCLMFSFRCMIRNPARLGTMQHLVSLALARTANDVAKVRIKWPNDIYSSAAYGNGKEMKKVAGIIINSTSISNQEFLATVGVGVNVENDHPTTCLRSIALGDPQIVTRELVLANFFNHFEPMFYDFLENGFCMFLEEYRSLWLHSGQRLQLEEEGSPEVTVVDLAPDTGFLLAKQDTGEKHELQPDGRSLDLFQGLIRVKR
uniref:BPL/LPL catalytic domain-containing protein n=1 Tax=Rhodosorus marinus TaxID=101924 RepID=A0A7S3ECY7_9RHOD|mmetsp:Transcript_26193/g.102602  ORF Transcript_26193/g.102602 Transcript_26193/m.102602 type:complete len:279 (+) Transcript_26193:594-1430(+)